MAVKARKLLGAALLWVSALSSASAYSEDRSFLSSHSPPSYSLNLKLSAEDYVWIGQRIYQNECASKPEYLTHWGQGEGFPSMGIGHFIWFPANHSAPFQQSFPQLIEFITPSHAPPSWLLELESMNAPWSSKAEFDQAWSNPKLTQLREWLLQTQPQQARFIVEQFKSRWHKAMLTLPLQQQTFYRARLAALMASKQGSFAVIDYVNFKGMGESLQESYQGQTWGLLSVLKVMRFDPDMSDSQLLDAFIEAAKQRLTLRAQLAPAQRNEQRWLKGWFKRLQDYRSKPEQSR